MCLYLYNAVHGRVEICCAHTAVYIMKVQYIDCCCCCCWCEHFVVYWYSQAIYNHLPPQSSVAPLNFYNNSRCGGVVWCGVVVHFFALALVVSQELERENDNHHKQHDVSKRYRDIRPLESNTNNQQTSH
jgi:hypothetical protein